MGDSNKKSTRNASGIAVICLFLGAAIGIAVDQVFAGMAIGIIAGMLLSAVMMRR